MDNSRNPEVRNTATVFTNGNNMEVEGDLDFHVVAVGEHRGGVPDFRVAAVVAEDAHLHPVLRQHLAQQTAAELDKKLTGASLAEAIIFIDNVSGNLGTVCCARC